MRKGENAANEHFLLFPQCSLPFLNQNTVFGSQCFQLDKSNILLFGKELNLYEKQSITFISIQTSLAVELAFTAMQFGASLSVKVKQHVCN